MGVKFYGKFELYIRGTEVSYQVGALNRPESYIKLLLYGIEYFIIRF